MNTTIKTFHGDHYGPAINKLDFCLPHVTIIGTNNCGKKIREYFKRKHVFVDVKSRHYYEDHIYVNFSI